MYQVSLLISLTLFGWFRVAGYIADPLLKGDAIRQIAGEPARFSRLAVPSQELKVITWNIERGVEFDRILSTLQTLDADVILLQEVDRFARRSGWRDVARELADGLGMNWLAAGEFQEIGESKGGIPALTGQAVLSKYPIEDAVVLAFKAQARLRWRLNPIQPRRGRRMALRVRTAGILVYDAHFESGSDDRLRCRQLEEILADQARHARDTEPVIIAGDFNNAPAIRSAMFGPLTAAAFADALRGDGGPRLTSIRHAHPIDWIFVRNLQPQAGRVAQVAHISDHYPVLATLAAEP
jgi:endonuclease/exonuclease/phosphatase family metal-dependent hydrolase